MNGQLSHFLRWGDDRRSQNQGISAPQEGREKQRPWVYTEPRSVVAEARRLKTPLAMATKPLIYTFCTRLLSFHSTDLENNRSVVGN